MGSIAAVELMNVQREELGKQLEGCKRIEEA